MTDGCASFNLSTTRYRVGTFGWAWLREPQPASTEGVTPATLAEAPSAYRFRKTLSGTRSPHKRAQAPAGGRGEGKALSPGTPRRAQRLSLSTSPNRG
jgi:hypothetical protein